MRNVGTADADSDAANTALKWFDYQQPSIHRALRNDPQEADNIHRWITPLAPCQTFIPDAVVTTDPGAPTVAAVTPTRGRLQIQLPVRFHDEFFTSHFASINRFEILRQFDWEREPVSLGEVPVRCTTWSVGDKIHVHVEPFLAVDEFPVIVGRHGQWEFVDSRLRPGVPLVSYFLRAIPFGETARTIAKLPPVKWLPVTMLYLPPRREPLPPLALVFRAGSLQVEGPTSVAAPTPPAPEFVLFESTGDRFVRRWRDDKSREPLKLEVWVQPEPIPLSGFYAPGDELTPDTTRVAKAVRAPSDLTRAPLPEETAGKQRLGTIEFNANSSDEGFESAQATLSFKLLRPGNRYRWFVRPQFESDDRRVVPLHLFLARNVPDSISAGAQLLAVDGLEFISRQEIDRVIEPLKDVHASDSQRWLKSDDLRFEHLESCPCHSDLPDTDKNQLPRPVRLFWCMPRGALDGGVEFLIQDAFNSRRVERTLVEVHSELIFARSQTDFRQATQWRLHTQHASGRLWQPQPAPQTSLSLWEHFLWSSEHNPLLTNLKTARTQVQDSLNELFPESGGVQNGNWRRLHQALINWFATLDSYFQSPLVLERSDTIEAPDRATEEQRVDLLFARMRNLFLGLPDVTGTSPSDLLDKYDDQIDRINAAMVALEAADPRQKTLRDSDADAAEAFKQEILDFDMARQLANIIDSRLDIVDAIRHASAGGTLDLAEANVMPLETWPHLAQWNTLVKQWFADTHPEDPKKPRRLTNDLLAPFGITTAPTGNTDDAQHRLMSGTAKIEANTQNTEARRLQTNLERLADASNPARPKVGQALARQVNEAAGLTAALAGIRALAEPRDWRLIRRPHHQISPEAERPADENQEKLADYFAPAEFSPNLAPADSVVHYFNWLERLGFAIDLALVDEDNRYFSQRELVQQFEALDWREILNSTGAEHQVYILLAREPDTVISESQQTNVFVDDDDALGYSFVKLAVVPKQLLADLSVVAKTAKVKTVTGSEAQTIELDTTFDATVFRANAADLKELRLTLLAGSSRSISLVAKVVPEVATPTNFKNLTTTQNSGLQVGDVVRIEDIVTGKAGDSPGELAKALANWTSLRGKMTIDNDTAYLVYQAGLATEQLALTTSATIVDAPKVVIVEPWSRRWQTAPAVGGWSHLLLPMQDRLGQKMFVAARRVSRYEPFLRWLNEVPIPTVDRLYGLESQLIVRRRQLLPGEEPRSLVVSMHPHPSRIEFLYRLPPSGSQSLLSAEAKRRTAFLECQLEFSRTLPTDLAEQVFDGNTFPESNLITVAQAAVSGASELVINKGTGDTPSAYNSAILVFDGQAVLVDKGTDQTDKIKLTLKGTLNAPLALGPGRAIKQPGLTEPADLRPRFGFVKSGAKLFLTDGHATRESLVGYPAWIFKSDDPSQSPVAGTIITGFDPQTRLITLSAALSSFSGKGVLTLLSQEPESQFQPLATSGPAEEFTLFRHERLVSLANLPYYFDYQARIEPRYAADVIGAPEAIEASPPTATRSPGWTAVRPPRVKVDDNSQLEVTLFLNRFADLLSAEELSQAERLDETANLKVGTTSLGQVPTRHALDLATEYQLWLELRPATDVVPPTRIMTQIAIMRFKPQAPKTVMKVELLHGITMSNGGPLDVPVQCAFAGTNAVPTFWLQFKLNVSAASVAEQLREKLQDPKNYRLMAVRSGRESRVAEAFP